MPPDLAVGIVLITGLSVLAFLVGHRLRSESTLPRRICFGLSLLLALFYAWTCSGKLGWAAIFPGHTVTIWSSLMPVLLSLAAGLVGQACGLSRSQCGLTIAALLILAAGYVVAPIARPLLAPIQLASQTKWRGNVCLQSHTSSCAPAAAVTLLRMRGIEAGEQSLARACLTSRQGTEPLGLYLGLAVTARPFGAKPVVASVDPSGWVARGELPNLALVRFANWHDTGPLHRLLGPRGEGHAVVVTGQDKHGNWLIADPAFGMTAWSDAQFRSRFTGDAIYLTGLH